MKILDLCYELYKQNWVRDHVSDNQLNATIKNWYEANVEFSYMENYFIPFDEYIEENGYFGELYVCKDEFEQAEFQDNEYMKYLLNDDELYNKYLLELELENNNIEL